MKYNIKSIFLLLFLIFGQTAFAKSTIKYFWVNSTKTTVNENSCLQVQSNDKIEAKAWTSYCSLIKKFDYKPGYIYRIKVKEKERKGVSQTVLRKVISQEIDSRLRLNDHWLVTHINNKAIAAMDEEVEPPTFEINISRNEIMGKDGCNRFSGPINVLDNSTLSFGRMLSTRMACRRADVSNQFYNALETATNYQIENNTLTFFNTEGNSVLKMKKLD